jgi:hypothetical protein
MVERQSLLEYPVALDIRSVRLTVLDLKDIW